VGAGGGTEGAGCGRVTVAVGLCASAVFSATTGNRSSKMKTTKMRMALVLGTITSLWNLCAVASPRSTLS
jgi:hypothetical protein